MTFLLIIIILLLIWMFFGDRIKAWARRRAYDKMEDFFRAQMGMPSKKEERKRRKNEEKEGFRHTQQAPSRNPDEPLIPKEYAEDVEFTEYKEFTSTTTVTEETDEKGKTKKIKVESQVEDAEYTEIKL